jgi:5-methylcytosine-specific restriction endonuclease McrA
MTPSGKDVRRKVEKLVGKLPSKVQVDHILPKADGGGDALKNLQLLPEKVHQKKTAVENAVRAKVGRRGKSGRAR